MPNKYQNLAIKAAACWQEIDAYAMAEAALVLALQAWEKLCAIYPKAELPYEDGFRLFVQRAELASKQNAQDVAFACLKTAREYLVHCPQQVSNN